MRFWKTFSHSARGLILTALLLIIGLGSVKVVPFLLHHPTQNVANKSVLGATTAVDVLRGLGYNVPVTFNDNVINQKDLTVNGNTMLNGDVTIKGRHLDLGTGTITASNIITGITAGAGIQTTSGTTPTITNTGVLSIAGQTGAVTFAQGSGISISGLTISNTGVTSVQGQSGAVSLTQGSGIAISGTTITNQDPGSSQKIFSTITVNGTSFSAGSNTAILSFAAGNGINITPDITNAKLTIADTLASGLTPNGVIFASGSSSLASLTPGTNGYVLQSTGTNTPPVWAAVAGANPSFATLSSGTNTSAAMVVGTGASLNFTGSGTINASSLLGNTWVSPGAIGATTPSTGAFSTLTGTTVNGLTIPNNGTNTLSIAAGKTLAVNNSLTLSGVDATAFTLPTTSDTLIGRTSTDILTNKTLTAPVINGIVTTTGLTLPAFTAAGNITGSGSPTISSFGAINGLTLNANADGFSVAGGTAPRTLTVTGSNIILTGGGNTLTLTGNATLNQNLTTAANPTFTSLGLTNTSNQLQIDTNGTLTWTPTAARTITLPDVTGIAITTGNLSSITQTGTIASGTWNGTAIGAQYGGTGINTSAATGVPSINSGTWSVNAQLPVYLGGTGTNSLTANGVLYGSGSGAIQALTPGSSGYVLQSNGTNTPPSWISSASIGTNNWQEGNGVLAPKNITDDLAIGGVATTSAFSTSALFQINGLTGNATTSGSLTFNNSANATIGVSVPGLWTLNGNQFNYRRQVTITNNSSTQTLPQNYAVTFSASGATASDLCTNTQASNNDLRTSFGTTTEISRNITRTCNTSLTITIQLQSSIAASGSSNNYYIYYNNPNIAASGSGFTPSSNAQLDSFDNVAGWTSSDNTNLALSQETTIKQEGTGSLKAVQTTQPSGNIGTWSTTGQGQFVGNSLGRPVVSVSTGGTTYMYMLPINGKVYRAQVDPTGNVGVFSTTGQAQIASATESLLTQTATIGGTSYIYQFEAPSTVYRAQLDTSGNVGTWATTGQAQFPASMVNDTMAGTVNTVGGTTYLYYIGGTLSGFTYLSTVYRAQLDTSGNVGTWATTGQAQLPIKIQYPNVLSESISGTTYMYMLGGQQNGSTTLSTVYRAQLDTSGNVGTWATTGQANLPFTNLQSLNITSLQSGGATYFYMVGGTNGTDQSTIYKATLDGSGNVGTWATTSQAQFPTTISNTTTTMLTASGTSYIYTFMGSLNGSNSSSVYRATIGTPVFQATKTISSTDLTNYGALQLQVYASRTGQYMSFDFSNDGGTTWVTNPITMSSANTWETKIFNISGLSSGQKNTVTKIRINVSDSSTGFTAYFDDLEALPFYFTDTAPTLSASAFLNATLQGINLGLKAQGIGGAINLNYDPLGNAGTGGLNLYNGSSTLEFSVDGNGNASHSGNLTFNGVNGSAIKLLNGSNLNLQTATGGDAGLSTKFAFTNSGNLGIGTAAPLYALDVQNSQAATAAAEIYNTNNGANADALALKLGFTGNGTVPTSQNAGNSFVRFLNGNGVAQGSIDSNGLGGVTYSTGGIDFAEYFTKDPQTSFATGDVVSLGGTEGNIATKATKGYDTKLVGIVSKHPGYVGGTPGENKVLVGLTGQLPVKVSTENGPIHAGDMLTSSNTFPGVAMKATQPGEIIAKALENYTGTGIGLIQVYVSASYADPQIQITGSGDLNIPSDANQTNTPSMPTLLAQNQKITSGQQLNENFVSQGQFVQIAGTVSLLQNQVATLSAQVEKIDDLSKQITDIAKRLPGEQSEQATQSSVLGSSLSPTDATVSGNLTIIGKTLLTNLGVTGVITDGLLNINGMDLTVGTPSATFNTLSGPLKLQSLDVAGLDFENGKVTIDTGGNITVNAAITTKKINIDTTDPATTSFGEDTLPAGKTSVTIPANTVTPHSGIFVTPKGVVDEPLGILEQQPEKGFTVGVSHSLSKDLEFNWWVVN